jgi:hypothetical protein
MRYVVKSTACALLCILLQALTLRAREADAPRFVLHRAEGDPLVGSLQKLGADWSIDLAGSKSTRTEGTEIVALRRLNIPLPGRPLDEQIVFVNGDQVPGALLEIANERLRFRPALGFEGEWHLPVSALSSIWLGNPEGVEYAERRRRRWLAERRSRDQVLLRNGDVLEGILTNLDRQALHLEVKRKKISIARDKVAGVALSTELTGVPRPRGAYGHLVLANGCRLALALARCDDGKALTGKTLFDTEVKVPIDAVIALDLRQGRAIYLSDLKPLRYEHTSYLGVFWPYVTDGSVAGRDLRLHGGTYDKGLGMHSQSRLTYDLAGGYRRFEALAGLDDSADATGGAQIKVLVDGRPQEMSEARGELDGGPRHVRINVAGAKELTLVVEFSRRGDVQGHVNWADARLIK